MDTISCCTPCPTVQTVNVPGIEGPTGSNGTNGTNGVNAFTVLTQPFTIPALNTSSTAFVANSSWMVLGQKVFSGDGTNQGSFEVTSLPGTTSVGLKFLGFTGDSIAGSIIALGAGVSPSGVEPPTVTMLPTLSAYAVGGTQALTNSFAQALTLQVTLGVTGHHVLFCSARFDYVAATFAANQIITLKLRRTNNTPGDIADSIGNLQTQIITTKSFTAGQITLVAVDYNGTVGDVIQPFVQVDTVPGAGTVEVVECGVFALPIF